MAAPDREQRPPWHTAADPAPTHRTEPLRIWINLTGRQAGLVAITAAASSAHPVIPLIGGVALTHERMARW